METLVQDLRYALRSLRRAPGIAIVATITLALGIGANTAIFSVVKSLVLEPFPFETGQLVSVWSTAPQGANDHNEASGADFRDWRGTTQSFDHLVAHTWWTANFTGGDQPERIQGFRVSPDYFDALDVRPILGRAFQAGDDEPGKDALVILSYGLWQRRFAGDASVIGTTVNINGFSRTIVGVMPRGMNFPTPADAWAPLSLSAESWANRRGHYMLITGRLKPGVTVERARAEAAALGQRLAADHPETNLGWGVSVQPFQKDATRMLAPILYVLFGAVGFVLLIACANVANLMLARASGRRRELAIRTALGAARSRITRLVLTESLMLGLSGGVAGVLVGVWGVDLLVSLVPPGHARFMSGFDTIRVDGTVLAFTFAIALLSVLLFGVVPAVRASRSPSNEPLKAGGVIESRERNRLRRGLVVAEVALALVLLVGAGLMYRTFRYLGGIEPGFDGNGVALTSLVLPARSYPGDSTLSRFAADLVARVAAIPGVRGAATTNMVPMCDCNSTSSFTVIGDPPVDPARRPNVGWRVVSPDYFTALRIPVREGRAFTGGDVAQRPGVVIVNETLARRWFAEGGALGRRLFVDGDTTRAVEVVGVVGDVRHFGPVRPVEPELYLPQAQRPENALTIVARGDGDPAMLLPLLRRAVREVDADLPVYDQRTMTEVMRLAIGAWRFSMRLLAGLGVVALVLAGVGIYGVIAHLVTQRTREIGIRVALGGSERSVLRLTVGQGMAPAAFGVLIGLAAALAITRVLSSQMVGVSPRDPLTFVAVAALLLGVALTACLGPARRAARVDPMVALRSE